MKKQQNVSAVLNPVRTKEDLKFEDNLRPETFDEFIGQETIKKKLNIFITPIVLSKSAIARPRRTYERWWRFCAVVLVKGSAGRSWICPPPFFCSRKEPKTHFQPGFVQFAIQAPANSEVLQSRA